MKNAIQVANSTPEDITIIFEFYDLAIEHQKKVSPKQWQGFDSELIKEEIADGRQYKILVDGNVAAIFAVTYKDPQIWLGKDGEAAVYIHRIVTHPNYRGYGFVKVIIDWAKEYRKTKPLDYIRMDTWADNERLLKYYTGCGFNHVGEIKIAANSGLPKHYEGITLNLFEIKL
ncbi:GNAT family N-acetyltransferase [Pedobacter sp. UBA4863]|uniref:GNAT family N-acetyltransferase n=1 Tax=Pedobacter sp. UBA4863 TaxID=1947060 RepID=UPI002600F145|nr:GNAT family N-acetyltransferase [Pedobacter sp. UBA4863]